MFRLLKIILVFLFVYSVFPNDLRNNFRVFAPEFIPASGEFEVSVFISPIYSDVEELELYLIPDPTLTIDKVQLWTDRGKSNLSYTSHFLETFSTSSQNVSIDLTDTSTIAINSFFQVVIGFITNTKTTNELKIYGELIQNEKVVGHLVSSDHKQIVDQAYLYSIPFKYYDKYPIAENSARFNPGSYLNIPLTYKFENSLSAEFWIKSEMINSAFLKIINLESNRTEYSISINENQMLVTSSEKNNMFKIRPVFISGNIWYHFILNFNKTESKFSVNCNSAEVMAIENINYFDIENLVLHFQNDGSAGNFELDQLRIIENNNSSLLEVIKNRNYSAYYADSSSVLLQINFFEAELNNSLTQRTISFEGLKLVKSDVPIFPRAPIVNVNLMNNFFDVQWSGGDVTNAAYYILERSIGNDSFIEVGRASAENENQKQYSILSEKQNLPEIIYFRVKQVNKDGSDIYSDIVKIGQGVIEDVLIGQNFPNPFNPATLIEFELLQDSDIELKIYNLAGKEIALLHKGHLHEGIHRFKFDATGLPSGIYLYQITTPLSTQTQKMILAK